MASLRKIRSSTSPSLRRENVISVRTDRLFQCSRLTICLECFYQVYDTCRLANSICWLALSDVTGDTSKRARGCGQPAWGVVSGLLKATSAGHHSEQSRSAADASGWGWIIRVLSKFTLWLQTVLARTRMCEHIFWGCLRAQASWARLISH